MTAPPITIRPATPAEHEPAVELLADAFERDPVISAATDRASEAAVARRAIFRTSLATTLQQGGALLVAHESGNESAGPGALLGAAIIRDPAPGRLRDAAHQVRAAVAFLRMLRLLGTQALTLLNDADRVSRRHAPRAPHHVLIAVGVTADARGLGVGRALVEATVDRARADPDSWGVRLETENASNVDRYERWGFELVASVEVDPVTVHVMARPTRSHEEDTRDQPRT